MSNYPRTLRKRASPSSCSFVFRIISNLMFGFAYAKTRNEMTHIKDNIYMMYIEEM